jgi:hypothetical protein
MQSRTKLISGFRTLKALLETLQKDEFEKGALDYFDMVSWLESKITGKKFGEIIREKAVSD